ncbi:hypothetical protein F441_07228 [Phytophthora nicotianae CJ01A1]|uniref:Uncharacterized protein n=2 Tax=Phytophthora nicotianae TaxID=4792 RepID=W2YPM2_PHYNI|nr:hypothetical protein F441_07228 [Phytophthora nicotianae CJ01A1]ETP36129.1 hypothetical protein F442_15839 [Phytophthora nicotianae P10297]
MRGTKRSFRLGVDRAEVYLDESYCNVNHVTGKTWLTADKIRYVRVLLLQELLKAKEQY